jgi:hypothetical protein
MSERTVLVREPEYTEMRVVGDGQAKAFARQLIRDGKAFAARPEQEGSWLFTVRETNHPSRWEYA